MSHPTSKPQENILFNVRVNATNVSPDLQLSRWLTYIQLFAKFGFQAHWICDSAPLPENISTMALPYIQTPPPAKSTSLLTKLFRKDKKLEAAPTDIQFAFALSELSPKSTRNNYRNIIFVHNQFEVTDRYRLQLSQSFKIISNSLTLKKWIVENFQIEPNKIEVLYPYFDREIYNSKDRLQMRQSIRSKAGYSQTDFIIGYARYGDASPIENEFVEQLSIELNQNHEIKFIKYDDKSGVTRQDFYHTIDFFVSPIASYRFGFSALETMACGVPVLATPTSGVADIIPSKQCILPFDRHEKWASYISNLKAQSDWLSSIGRQNSERALLFDENNHLKRFLALLAAENLISI